MLLSLAAGICAILTFSLLPASATAGERRNILVLASHDSQQPAYELFMSGFRSGANAAASDGLELFTEFLDSARFPQADHRVRMRRLLQEKYKATRIDLVISTSPLALGFVVENRNTLFPNVPVVYALVATQELPLQPLPNDVIGVLDRFDPAKTLAMALRLQPQARRVVIVTGADAFDKMWEDIARRQLQTDATGLEFLYLSGLPLPRLLEEVARLPRDTIVLFLSVLRDGAGVTFRSPDIAQKVAAESGAPAYSIFPSYFGRGVVGGYMNSFEAVGERTAAIALRLLSGERPEQVRGASGPEGSYVADSRQLRRWGLSESRLPPGAEVRFRPPSLWEQHRLLILAGTAIVVLQAGLITALLVQRVRRRRAEKEALALNGRLLTAHEDERKHLARELHDDLTQRLARLAIDAGRMENASAAAEGLRPLREDLVRLSEDVHAMSYRLHPSVLDDLGLIEALRAECERVARSGALRVDVDASGVPGALPAEASLCLFRVAQEALSNAARHARANAVTVLLARSGKGLQLAVSDNGRGFDPARPRDHTSLGLASMRERVRLLRGELDIESTPGRGTTVVAWVPA